MGYIMRVQTSMCIAYYKNGSAVVSKWQSTEPGLSLTFLILIFLKASYVFWLEFLMKLYQIGTRCQGETDGAFNTPPPAKVWSDN